MTNNIMKLSNSRKIKFKIHNAEHTSKKYTILQVTEYISMINNTADI